MSAWENCHKRAHKNKEYTPLADYQALSDHARLILTYLIPCHLTRTGQLPTASLLAPYPRLAALFGPLATAIRGASLAAFDDALLAGARVFVRRRVYLALESCRLVVLRNLMRKVFLAGGHEPGKSGQAEGAPPVRRTRIPVAEFLAAVRLSAGGDRAAMAVDRDEVECFIANLIYKVRAFYARLRRLRAWLGFACWGCCLMGA
jgi:COP9 signalosome complex subunit 12